MDLFAPYELIFSVICMVSEGSLAPSKLVLEDTRMPILGLELNGCWISPSQTNCLDIRIHPALSRDDKERS